MSENIAKIEEPRVSRLNLVRAGGGDTGLLKIPKRGRAMVDIDSIVPDPRNERKVFRRIPELALTIKAVGLIDPPTVVPLEDGQPSRPFQRSSTLHSGWHCNFGALDCRRRRARSTSLKARRDRRRASRSRALLARARRRIVPAQSARRLARAVARAQAARWVT